MALNTFGEGGEGGNMCDVHINNGVNNGTRTLISGTVRKEHESGLGRGVAVVAVAAAVVAKVVVPVADIAVVLLLVYIY